MHWGDGGRGGRAWCCGGPQSPSRCPFLPGGVGVRTAPPEPSVAASVGRFLELRSLPCPVADGISHCGCRIHRSPWLPICEGRPSAEAAWTSLPQEVMAKGLLPVKATHDDHCGGSAQTGFSNFITSWKGNKHRHLELGDTDLKASNRAEPVSARRSRARVPRRPGPRSAEARAQGWGPSHVPTVPGWERVVPPRDTRLGRRQPLRTPGRAQTVPPHTRLPGRRQPPRHMQPRRGPRGEGGAASRASFPRLLSVTGDLCSPRPGAICCRKPGPSEEWLLNY